MILSHRARLSSTTTGALRNLVRKGSVELKGVALRRRCTWSELENKRAKGIRDRPRREGKARLLWHVELAGLGARGDLLRRLERFDCELELSNRLYELHLDEVFLVNHVVRLQQLVLRGVDERCWVPLGYPGMGSLARGTLTPAPL